MGVLRDERVPLFDERRVSVVQRRIRCGFSRSGRWSGS